MFEQIFGHTAAVDQLTDDIRQDTLPSGILLYGRHYSGRLTLALEIARVVSCEASGEEGCSCPSCRRSRELVNPYMLMLLQRDMLPVILASYQGFDSARNHRSKLQFARTVRILLSRFHSVFIQCSPAAKKSLFETAADTDDLINDFLEADESSAAAAALAKKILSKAKKLSEGSSTVSVHAVRAVAGWLHSNTEQVTKVVIIDAVDRLNNSAVNSMLKILEEPPERVYFILLAENRNRILPTILSRARSYYLGDRPEQESEVISSVFYQSPDDYDGLQTFFSEIQGIDCRKLREDAQQFLFSALGRRSSTGEQTAQIIAAVAKGHLLQQFFREIAAVVQDEKDEGFLSDESALRILHLAGELHTREDVYNQSPSLLAETLYYRIRDCI